MEFKRITLELTREKYIQQTKAVTQLNRDLKQIADNLGLPDVLTLYITALAINTSGTSFIAERKGNRLAKASEYALYVSEMIINMVKAHLSMLEEMESADCN